MELHSLDPYPNPSFDFYYNHSFDQFDYVPDGLLSNCEDGFGGVWDDLFSYSSSTVTTSPPDELSREDPHALIVGDAGAKSSTKPNMNLMRNAARKVKSDAAKPQRVAFKVKSKLDVLDDGYRWRKYGKKPIKNSPNLRNYYKCTGGGCQVKKIVERCAEDSSYVITQYNGVHTH